VPNPPSAPTGRIVLFGATGYTGDLTARTLVVAGVRPVLAGRSADRLSRLAADVGGARGPLEVLVADVTEPASVSALVQRGDVLLTTVGPFARWGRAAVEAAVSVGAHYVDSAGEGSFVRSVVREHGPRAADAGSVLLTACGYDYIPGNLAGALALRAADAVGTPASVDVGYFVTGAVGMGGASGGTRASAVTIMSDAGCALRDGRLVPERPGAELLHLEAGGRRRPAFTVPATEQFFLPRLESSVRSVRVGLGWFGPLTPAMTIASRAAGVLDRVPPLRAGLARAVGPLVQRAARGSSGGPDEGVRARTGSLVAADVRGPGGDLLAHVELTGPNVYTLTAYLLAWAGRALAGLVPGVPPPSAAGALGPVEAFGLDTLQAACAEAGLVEAEGAG
jgi:short subunit dehydrogenase-like uncharacterized protein